MILKDVASLGTGSNALRSVPVFISARHGKGSELGLAVREWQGGKLWHLQRKKEGVSGHLTVEEWHALAAMLEALSLFSHS